MRVFDTYYFNIIDKVRFKDTKPYVDKMLKDLGLSYTDVDFMLYEVVQDKIPEICKKMPNLKKYYFYDKTDNNYGISSVTKDWQAGNVHANKEDWGDVETVFSKIPRPYNLPFGYYSLSGINWFQDSDPSPAVIQWDMWKNEIPNTHFAPFISNRILQLRCYDDGIKHNNVAVSIEITDGDAIRDSKPVIEKLKPYFGEPQNMVRSCTFSKEESERNRKQEKEACKALAQKALSYLPQPGNMGAIQFDKDLGRVADKKETDAAFKGTGFERVKGQPNWLHLYCAMDQTRGYKYEAFVQKISIGNIFRCWIDITGSNFRIKFEQPDYAVDQEGKSQEILNQFAKFCVYAKEEFGAEIEKSFGKTPEWFFG